MTIFYYDNWSLSDAEDNPQRLFLFPDDVTKSTKNSFTTVKYSNRKNIFSIPIQSSPDKYFSDAHYYQNINIIKHAFQAAPAWLFREMAILKHGLLITDEMVLHAPKTYQYLKECYNDFISKYNRVNEPVCA